MNPFNLLRNRMIKGGKDRAGTYKLPKGATLPNFSPNKQAGPPTVSHSRPEPQISQPALFNHPEEQPVVPIQPPAQKPGRAATPLAAAPLAPAQPVSAGGAGAHDGKAVGSLGPKASPGPGVWNRSAGWFSGLFHRWNVKRKTSPFQGRSIQTELALDKVVVARNDLSEEDLEVVPVGKKQKPPQQLAQHDQCQTISTIQ
jgi:hypothetical protein